MLNSSFFIEVIHKYMVDSVTVVLFRNVYNFVITTKITNIRYQL